MFSPPDDVLDSTAFTYVEVVNGEVASSISLNTVAEWEPVPVGGNLAAGVVTTVNVSQGQEVGPGAVLYSVDLRPVVVAQGSIPAFRPMSRGTAGADVAQLQSMLAELGFYSGPADGDFGYGTQRAVVAWQEGLGLTGDGMVQSGDIIFVPALPTRVALDPDVVRTGATLGSGQIVLSTLPATPDFTIPVTQNQASRISAGTRVDVTGPDGQQWAAVTTVGVLAAMFPAVAAARRDPLTELRVP